MHVYVYSLMHTIRKYIYTHTQPSMHRVRMQRHARAHLIVHHPKERRIHMRRMGAWARGDQQIVQ